VFAESRCRSAGRRQRRSAQSARRALFRNPSFSADCTRIQTDEAMNVRTRAWVDQWIKAHIQDRAATHGDALTDTQALVKRCLADARAAGLTPAMIDETVGDLGDFLELAARWAVAPAKPDHPG